MKSLFKQGNPSNEKQVKRIYSMTDGWLIKLYTGFPKELTDLINLKTKYKFSPQVFSLAIDTFTSYLLKYLNQGYYF
jgi:hypothetical protein